MGEECDGCKDVLSEVKKLETVMDKRHSEYIDRVIDYNVDKAKQDGSMRALHKRMDASDKREEGRAVTLLKHMEGEEMHHIKVEAHMAEANVIMQNMAPKAEVVRVDGRMNTMWIVGTLAFMFFVSVVGLGIWWIKADINAHSTKASKANYSALKKVIEKVKK